MVVQVVWSSRLVRKTVIVKCTMNYNVDRCDNLSERTGQLSWSLANWTRLDWSVYWSLCCCCCCCCCAVGGGFILLWVCLYWRHINIISAMKMSQQNAASLHSLARSYDGCDNNFNITHTTSSASSPTLQFTASSVHVIFNTITTLRPSVKRIVHCCCLWWVAWPCDFDLWPFDLLSL